MDTDDEFMSGSGSEEEGFGGTQESDDFEGSSCAVSLAV
jgi:hypothetical protein